MPLADKQIERIVREVISRLAAMRGDGADVRADSRPDGNAGRLRLVERVVSTAQLAGRLEGVREVVGPSGAVITPAARDVLKERGVRFVRTADGEATEGAASLVIGVAESGYEAGPLVQRLATGGRCVRTAGGGSLGEVVAAVADAARGGSLGAVLTGETAAALCVANRRRGVRAALGESVDAANAAVAAIGANLLVANPRTCGEVALEQILAAFADGGPRCCPAELRGLLD